MTPPTPKHDSGESSFDSDISEGQLLAAARLASMASASREAAQAESSVTDDQARRSTRDTSVELLAAARLMTAHDEDAAEHTEVAADAGDESVESEPSDDDEIPELQRFCKDGVDYVVVERFGDTGVRIVPAENRRILRLYEKKTRKAVKKNRKSK